MIDEQLKNIHTAILDPCFILFLFRDALCSFGEEVLIRMMEKRVYYFQIVEFKASL